MENDIRIDINYAPLTLDDDFIERSRRLVGNIYLPSLEDLIILKLMSSERKDIGDLKRILRQSWNKLDKQYLHRRARQAGLERELEKLLKRLGLHPG